MSDRITNHHAVCGALVFVEFENILGSHFRPHYFAAREGGAPVEQCPMCKQALRLTRNERDEPIATQRPRVISMLEMDQRIDRARAELLAGGEIDAETVAAMYAQIERGDEFEEIAALYGRDPETLRAELAAWIASDAGRAEEPASVAMT